MRWAFVADFPFHPGFGVFRELAPPRDWTIVWEPDYISDWFGRINHLPPCDDRDGIWQTGKRGIIQFEDLHVLPVDEQRGPTFTQHYEASVRAFLTVPLDWRLAVAGGMMRWALVIDIDYKTPKPTPRDWTTVLGRDLERVSYWFGPINQLPACKDKERGIWRTGARAVLQFNGWEVIPDEFRGSTEQLFTQHSDIALKMFWKLPLDHRLLGE